MGIDAIKEAIRDVPDFPKEGILFKDITPVLSDPDLLNDAVALFAARHRENQIKQVIGIEARGFIFGAALALQLGAGFVPIRKKGKLPAATKELTYDLEYGSATIEIHEDAVKDGERVLLIDDLLATGGTAAAAIHLLQDLGAEVVEADFLIELDFLKGREKLTECPVYAPIVF